MRIKLGFGSCVLALLGMWSAAQPASAQTLSITDGSIALDGERELSFTRDDDVSIELIPDAFRTVNVSGVMQYASRHGLMRLNQKINA